MATAIFPTNSPYGGCSGGFMPCAGQARPNGGAIGTTPKPRGASIRKVLLHPEQDFVNDNRRLALCLQLGQQVIKLRKFLPS